LPLASHSNVVNKKRNRYNQSNMSDFLVALMFGAGVGGWVYYQVARASGGESKNSYIAAGISGAIGFFVIYSLLKFFFAE